MDLYENPEIGPRPLHHVGDYYQPGPSDALEAAGDQIHMNGFGW